MTVLAIVLKFITFPGAYLKGFFEQVMCKICGCPVESDGYLRLDGACGHADHIPAEKCGRAFSIAFFPGLVTFLLGAFLWVSGLGALALLKVRPSDSVVMFVVYTLFTYLGISLLNNVFSMPEVAHNSRNLLYGKESKANIAAKILLFIPSVLNMVGAQAERFGINFLVLVGSSVAAFILL